MPVDVSQAIEHHRQGHLEQAARTYEAALEEDPDRPDVLHLLGLVALQQGDPRRAGALIHRAVTLQPAEAAYHASLAEVF